MTVRPDDLSEALAALHGRPELRERMAEAAYRRALGRDLDPAAIGAQWLHAVAAVCPLPAQRELPPQSPEPDDVLKSGSEAVINC
jgi:hypothetical protein